ncbi:MAG: amidohydrolase family protein [Xanthomonadaceae bacterium]|nr:amidohydrolase family protein [Xanthomonadaceae bacterium]
MGRAQRNPKLPNVIDWFSSALPILRAEDSVGTLKAGYRADFVLLDNDPLGVAPRVIADLHVLSTWVDGEAVYSAPER